ncbi:dihydroneopterin triphosphate diphosphatase [Rhodocyclus tenuis]|uniref:Dihydroneopterin triphosphate diphosphatase n=2 Tax=Rhodocyclus TaxID=1064 RepID=A0A6L5JTE4_RHOTE|nr:dihydroneopterin triphosphate diphosphatase [Rhodocyclus gracilis]MQY50663.1 dihydroneopterin triphosphate diphosphatase [Rhodocyclus gracilis]MRD72666.1 dihydroneopterin triphosphate diphosphatase [Rhodocyclus gracilis]NJA88193.1 dihydroneopterin triphosphate diphosphatase [Rhodocyclus gracilis]
MSDVSAAPRWKRPVSVLVVIHTPDLQVLLLERASHPGYWQSVTGSQEEGESLAETARREVGEETGIVVAANSTAIADSASDTGSCYLLDWQQSSRFEIFAEWRHRYAPGVTHNEEHVYSLEIPAPCPVTLAPGEHLAYRWLPWQAAAAECFSWSNRDAILALPERLRRTTPGR